jgi:hypothetical protein
MQYTHWHLQHCKSQLSKGYIRADQQQHTFPPHIECIQMIKAPSSDQEHTVCTWESQNSTTFLQDTSDSLAREVQPIQRDKVHNSLLDHENKSPHRNLSTGPH